MIVAAQQELTLQWWEERSGKFSLYISRLVKEEIAKGDPIAAERRVARTMGLPELAIGEVALKLADDLLGDRLIPQAAASDAIHVAVASVNGMHYLLTWNCRHLANAVLRNQIEAVVEDSGYACPVICTPQELMEDD